MSETWFDSGVTEKDIGRNHLDDVTYARIFIRDKTGVKIKTIRFDDTTGTYHYQILTERDISEQVILELRDQVRGMKDRPHIIQNITKQLNILEVEYKARYGSEPDVDRRITSYSCLYV